MKKHEELITPENIALTVNIPNVYERIEAFLIDLVVLSIITLGILFITRFMSIISNEIANAISMLAIFFLWNGYFIYYELKRGATIGKKKKGFRIVSIDGNFLRPSAIYVRNLMREIEFFLPLKLLAAITAGNLLSIDISGFWPFLWIVIFSFFPYFNKRNRRIGDIFAGTMVISIPQAKLQKDLIEKTKLTNKTAKIEKTNFEFVFSDEMLNIYGKDELEVLERILRSYSEIPKKESKKLFAILTEKIIKKINYSETLLQKQHKNFLDEFYQKQRKYLENKLLRGKSLKRRTERKKK